MATAKTASTSTTAGLPGQRPDADSLERWLLPAYHQVFRHVFDGNPSAHEPWDGAYRTDVHEYRSTVMCSVFRTFQGWTALSSMARTEGLLNVLPIPHAMVYLLLRALQDDVADDDLCGAANGQSLPVTAAHHGVLLPGMSPIPNVEPGDTVWWHPDAVHSVDPVTDQKGWGSVMYIPARAPGMVTQDLMSQPASNRHPTARLVTARNAPVAVVRCLAAA